MNANLAEENLQTIRLLMERSALYRRALAPIMLCAGIFGLVAAAIGICFQIVEPRPFAILWLSTAVVVIICSFLLARRQAFADSEPFWSPPTYRVAQALLPPLLAGMVCSGALALLDVNWFVDLAMVLIWMLFYGCALHAAGFFTARGIKWFGWVFITSAIIFIVIFLTGHCPAYPLSGNILMGASFGLLHLAYGSYLYFTEKKTAAA